MKHHSVWLWMGLAACCMFLVSTSGTGCSSSSSGRGTLVDGGGGTGAGGAGGGQGGGVPFTRATKLDLLFMVDNSRGMADKHANLTETLPGWIDALVNPPVDPITGDQYFAPITDIHIAVITSSLGGHGGDLCAPGAVFNETQNDRAHLLPSVRLNLASYQSLGFLWWDPNQTAGGESNSVVLATTLQSHVQSVGETGCGFEAGLEAIYRFLVDPAPAVDVVVNGAVAEPQGIDSVLLQQRNDFLRPDSAVVIVALSDENDCSIIDGGQNWVAAQASAGGSQFFLPRAASACESDPNSACCRSCAVQEATPPTGCAPLDSDPSCQLGSYDVLGDHLNNRCFHQKQRFGLDFLYPVQRYVEALTSTTVSHVVGDVIQNSLLATRSRELVTFVPIVGVPWQDIATPGSLSGDELEYLSSAELAAKGLWDWLVPTCSVSAADGTCDQWNLADPPDDPLMIESIDPRTGVNPATGVALVDSNGPAFGPNSPANGHEYMIPGRNDLQYACIFELPAPRFCDALPFDVSCDCENDPAPASVASPLCQQTDGSYSTTQRFAKAYPGTRFLQVAKDIGDQAVVGSVCPKSPVPGTSGYAYTAVTNALLRRLSDVMAKP